MNTPKILITNDDGVSSTSLGMLAEELCKLGEVVVVAPDSERSCSSHSLSLNSDIHVSSKINKLNYLEVAISGTPADCVKFGIQQYGGFDLILSGINDGGNVGYHLFYSGTVAAALEGTMYGVSSIALSMERKIGKPDYPFAVRFASKISGMVLREPLSKGSALNINFPDIPESEIKGTMVTHQGDFRFDDIFEKNGEKYSLSGKIPFHTAGKSSDFNAVNEGFVSITPIHTDLTNHHLYRTLKHFESEI